MAKRRDRVRSLTGAGTVLSKGRSRLVAVEVENARQAAHGLDYMLRRAEDESERLRTEEAYYEVQLEAIRRGGGE